MLKLEIVEDIHVLTLDHGKANTLDIALCQSLIEQLESISDSARAVVITGTGRCFSAGVDLLQIRDGGSSYIREFLNSLRSVFMTVFNFPKPVVAAVNGHAVAGGCILACAADHRIMTNGPGRIGVAELTVGVPFPAAGLEIVRFALHGQSLQQMIYSGRLVSSTEALDIGLVDSLESPDQLLKSASESARALATIPAVSFALTKKRLRANVNSSLSTAANATYEQEVDEAWQSAELAQVIAKYVDSTLGR
jgi:enoyl-CoA hydratase